MSSAAAPVLVPSRLPPDAGDWASAFAIRLRDEVARPLFGAPNAEVFAELLPDALARGAVLRFRWLNALSRMPAEASVALVNEWLRPPPPGVLADLQRRAAVLLGPERSFQVQRSLTLTFTDAMEAAGAVLERWRSPRTGVRWLVELARISEVGAPHDVLAITWMMVLFRDVPAPAAEVADAAAAALLEHTAARLATVRAVVRDEIPVPSIVLDDRAISRAWLGAHLELVLPLLTLTGLALDEPAVAGIRIAKHRDPEDWELTIVEIALEVRGEPDDARLAVEERALRTGALGALTDGSAMLAITATSVP